MAKPKLFSVLNSLDTKAWLAFKQHMSGSTEADSNLKRLLEKLHAEKHLLNETGRAALIHSKCFTALSSKGFSNLCSRLFIRLEQWLASYQLEQETYATEILLVKYYNRNGLYKLANQTANRLSQKLEHNKAWDLEDERARYELYHQQYYSDNPIKYKQGGVILENLVDAYTRSIRSESLLYLCELHNWGRIQSYDFDVAKAELESVIDALPSDNLSDSLLKLKALVAEFEPTHLSELSEIIYNGTIKKGSDLQFIFFMYLLQCSLKLWESGKLKNQIEIAKLYDYGLDTGILLVNGLIPISRFYNICSMISATNTYEGAKAFIDQWYPKVQAKDKASVRMVAYAQNCPYHEREVDILTYLRTVKMETPLIRLLVGILKIIAFYKTRKEDLIILHNHIHNYKLLLKRDKTVGMKYYRTGCINFVKVLQLILKMEYKSIDLDLDQYKILPFRIWLKKQIKI